MAVPARTNRFAVVALLCGLFGLVLFGIGFGIAALVQAGRRGERGKGLAAGGIAASAVWTGIIVIMVAAALGSAFTADRDEAGHVTKSGKVLPASLHVGDCFNGFDGQTTARLVTAKPCTEPHEAEAVAKLRLTGDSFPGADEVLRQATAACELKTSHLQRSRYAADLDPYSIAPSKMSWSGGDREVLCLLRYTGAGTLTKPIAETVDTTRKAWRELVRGDCLGKWDEEAALQRTLSCTKPHWMEVYAVFRLPDGAYAGEKGTQHKAEAGCDKRAPKVFGKRDMPDYVSWVFPMRQEWATGVRTVVCLVESRSRPLKKPVVPR